MILSFGDTPPFARAVVIPWVASENPLLPLLFLTSSVPRRTAMSFEGAFDVSTSPTFEAGFLSESAPENDPLGLGRQQHIDFEISTTSKKKGRAVYWDDLDGGPEFGRVQLSTSNGPASLHIQ